VAQKTGQREHVGLVYTADTSPTGYTTRI